MDAPAPPHAQAWRAALLHSLAQWTAILGAVIAAATVVQALVREPGFLSRPATLLMYVGYVATVVAWLRPTMPYPTRAVVLCGGFLLAGAAAVVARGLAVAPVLVLSIAVLAAGLFLGRRTFVVLLVGCGAVVFSATPPAPTSPWMSAIGFACTTGVLGAIVLGVVRLLESMIDETARALERQREAEALRARTQGELEQTQATLFQTQKLDAIGRLAGGVAHDFNNTLQVILGWASVVRSAQDHGEIAEGLEEITAAARQGASLTRHLLALGRPSPRAPARLALGAFLTNALRSYRRLMPDEITIELEVAPDTAIDIDEVYLGQIVLNLVLNARDAMPAGGRLTIRVQRRDADASQSLTGQFGNEVIEIEVADTGTGMDAETRRRAFEPFFTTKGERGTGLGLATVSKVVQQAGGIIELDSTPGGGTTFRLCFAPSTSVDALATPSSAGAVPPRQERRRLLLAEDDRSIRESLARALRSAGFDVAEVADLAQASAALSRPFDILVTDGILPGGSTSALVDDFLATRPGARVIVCTGYLEDELPPRHTGGPRLELLAKPFAPGDLLARLSTDSAQLDA